MPDLVDKQRQRFLDLVIMARLVNSSIHLTIINLNEEKHHVPERGIELMTLQVTQNGSKLEISLIIF